MDEKFIELQVAKLNLKIATSTVAITSMLFSQVILLLLIHKQLSKANEKKSINESK